MTDTRHFMAVAELAAREAGTAIMQIRHGNHLGIRPKADGSPVTNADAHAHRIITRHLYYTGLPVLSEEGGTKDYAARRNWELFWMIDPLDGTKEFINGGDDFTVNIALIKAGRPVAGVIYVPAADTLYAGEKGQQAWKQAAGQTLLLPAPGSRIRLKDLREKPSLTVVLSRSHLSPGTMSFLDQFKDLRIQSLGSSLKFMMLAEGTVDIYPRLGVTMEWDTAAAHAILHACNRGIYDIDGFSELRYNKEDLRNPFFAAF